jgi:hypothetical protein
MMNLTNKNTGNYMKKEYKMTYSISGRTKAGTFCTLGFASTIEIAIAFWCQKYPRFNGHGKIKKQMAESFENGMICADFSKWEEVFSFSNNKELKNINLI